MEKFKNFSFLKNTSNHGLWVEILLFILYIYGN